MKSSLLLRIGIGICFVWIGYLIVRDPAGWAGLIPPWMSSVMPNPTTDMFVSGLLDMVIGAILILGLWTWLGALLGFLHLLVVIISVVSLKAWDIAARDIAILLACAALFVESPKPAFLARLLP